MEKIQSKKTSVFQNGLVWFGAGVSIAEILTGTYFSSLGFVKGLCAILIGHLIGGVLFFMAGLIGAKTGKSAMQTVQSSFGKLGGLFFAVLNVVQLVGWTSIMIYDGAISVNGIFVSGSAGIASGAGVSSAADISSAAGGLSALLQSRVLWCIVIGALIFAWIFFGIKNLGWLNKIAMGLLFVLSVVLCVVIFKDGFSGAVAAGEENVEDAMSFGAAIELAVAMPLSWLPLISDYTREAEKPVAATLCSTLTYNLVSIWMYVIGMSAAIFTGVGDIALIMVKAGLGIAALVILVLSTVTTTFLDAWSTGISCEAISSKINGKYAALATAVAGTVLAIIFPMDNITDFLYFIGSVFAPMAAIQIADFFIAKYSGEENKFDIAGIVIWCAGFVLYRYLLTVDIVVGNTLPCMIIVALITVLVRTVIRTIKAKRG